MYAFRSPTSRPGSSAAQRSSSGRGTRQVVHNRPPSEGSTGLTLQSRHTLLSRKLVSLWNQLGLSIVQRQAQLGIHSSAIFTKATEDNVVILLSLVHEAERQLEGIDDHRRPASAMDTAAPPAAASDLPPRPTSSLAMTERELAAHEEVLKDVFRAIRPVSGRSPYAHRIGLPPKVMPATYSPVPAPVQPVRLGSAAKAHPSASARDVNDQAARALNFEEAADARAHSGSQKQQHVEPAKQQTQEQDRQQEIIPASELRVPSATDRITLKGPEPVEEAGPASQKPTIGAWRELRVGSGEKSTSAAAVAAASVARRREGPPLSADKSKEMNETERIHRTLIDDDASAQLDILYLIHCHSILRLESESLADDRNKNYTARLTPQNSPYRSSRAGGAASSTDEPPQQQQPHPAASSAKGEDSSTPSKAKAYQQQGSQNPYERSSTSIYLSDVIQQKLDRLEMLERLNREKIVASALLGPATFQGIFVLTALETQERSALLAEYALEDSLLWNSAAGFLSMYLDARPLFRLAVTAQYRVEQEEKATRGFIEEAFLRKRHLLAHYAPCYDGDREGRGIIVELEQTDREQLREEEFDQRHIQYRLQRAREVVEIATIQDVETAVRQYKCADEAFRRTSLVLHCASGIVRRRLSAANRDAELLALKISHVLSPIRQLEEFITFHLERSNTAVEAVAGNPKQHFETFEHISLEELLARNELLVAEAAEWCLEVALPHQEWRDAVWATRAQQDQERLMLQEQQEYRSIVHDEQSLWLHIPQTVFKDSADALLNGFYFVYEEICTMEQDRWAHIPVEVMISELRVIEQIEQDMRRSVDQEMEEALETTAVIGIGSYTASFTADSVIRGREQELAAVTLQKFFHRVVKWKRHFREQLRITREEYAARKDEATSAAEQQLQEQEFAAERLQQFSKVAKKKREGRQLLQDIKGAKQESEKDKLKEIEEMEEAQIQSIAALIITVLAKGFLARRRLRERRRQKAEAWAREQRLKDAADTADLIRLETEMRCEVLMEQTMSRMKAQETEQEARRQLLLKLQISSGSGSQSQSRSPDGSSHLDGLLSAGPFPWEQGRRNTATPRGAGAAFTAAAGTNPPSQPPSGLQSASHTANSTRNNSLNDGIFHVMNTSSLTIPSTGTYSNQRTPANTPHVGAGHPGAGTAPLFFAETSSSAVLSGNSSASATSAQSGTSGRHLTSSHFYYPPPPNNSYATEYSGPAGAQISFAGSTSQISSQSCNSVYPPPQLIGMDSALISPENSIASLGGSGAPTSGSRGSGLRAPNNSVTSQGWNESSAAAPGGHPGQSFTRSATLSPSEMALAAPRAPNNSVTGNWSNDAMLLRFSLSASNTPAMLSPSTSFVTPGQMALRAPNNSIASDAGWLESFQHTGSGNHGNTSRSQSLSLSGFPRVPNNSVTDNHSVSNHNRGESVAPMLGLEAPELRAPNNTTTSFGFNQSETFGSGEWPRQSSSASIGGYESSLRVPNNSVTSTYGLGLGNRSQNSPGGNTDSCLTPPSDRSFLRSPPSRRQTFPRAPNNSVTTDYGGASLTTLVDRTPPLGSHPTGTPEAALSFPHLLHAEGVDSGNNSKRASISEPGERQLGANMSYVAPPAPNSSLAAPPVITYKTHRGVEAFTEEDLKDSPIRIPRGKGETSNQNQRQGEGLQPTGTGTGEGVPAGSFDAPIARDDTENPSAAQSSEGVRNVG